MRTDNDGGDTEKDNNGIYDDVDADNVDEYEDEHPHKDDANHHHANFVFLRLHGSTLSSSDYIEHGAYLIHRSIVESLNKLPSGQAIGLKEKIWHEKNCRRNKSSSKHSTQRAYTETIRCEEKIP